MPTSENGLRKTLCVGYCAYEGTQQSARGLAAHREVTEPFLSNGEAEHRKHPPKIVLFDRLSDEALDAL